MPSLYSFRTSSVGLLFSLPHRKGGEAREEELKPRKVKLIINFPRQINKKENISPSFSCSSSLLVAFALNNTKDDDDDDEKKKKKKNN